MKFLYAIDKYASLDKTNIYLLDQYLTASWKRVHSLGEEQDKIVRKTNPARWDALQTQLEIEMQINSGLRDVRALIMERDLTVFRALPPKITRDVEAQNIAEKIHAKFPYVIVSFQNNYNIDRWEIWLGKGTVSDTMNNIGIYLDGLLAGKGSI
jgi:hypothetical protein